MAEGTKNVVALIIESLIALALTSGLGAYYYQLMNSPDKVVWNQNKNVECLENNCSVGRKNIIVYRIGNKPLPNVKVLVGVEPEYEIIEDSILFQQYDTSIFNFFTAPSKTNVPGRVINSDDPELILPQAYKFNITELNPAYIYELTLKVKNKSGQPIQNFGIVQIEDEKLNRYDNQELSFKDYLRLYLVEVGALFIILTVILIFVIYLIHTKIFSRTDKGELK